jgi:4,5-DOPA dioxygenase extradiol
MTRLPTLFLSHGSPMHALESGEAGRAWAALGRVLPRPRAVLMVSAHWETSLPMVTGATAPETIHDFGGFPEALYRIRYPAPGSPEVAASTARLLRDAGVITGIDGLRGLDHGAWVPLRWMYPEADVPVVQLSVQPGLGTGHHLQVGRALAALADQGVLVVGSGHATHNLRDWMTSRGQPEPLPYVQAFSNWLHERLSNRDADAIVDYRQRAPGAARAHPSEEHFLPLLVALGAAGEHEQVERIVHACEGPALSLDSYLFGIDTPAGLAA